MAMKKFLSLLVTLVLCFTTLAGAWPAAAEASDTPETEDTEMTDPAAEEADGETPEIEYPDELRVGHTTITKGDFFTEMFGNNTADIDVRALIHGYNLVNWDQSQGVYLIDESVVEDVTVAMDEDGNKTYFLMLYDDLYYSDGTPITAWDYAFSLLLMMSPEIEQIGGKIYRAEHILGYKEYITGELPYLTGVGVLDDHQLTITLDSEFLPYFFEIGLLLCVPYPIYEIAPGCKVYAGDAYSVGNGYGYGIRIGNEDPNVTEPIYTAELLQKTIMDPETGYNSHPSVVSGPYVLTDYDYETAHFRINDYYKGAWGGNELPEDYQFEVQDFAGVGAGSLAHNSHTGPNVYKVMRYKDDGEENPMYLVKPTIERISFSLANNDTMKEDLESGKFHLVNKVTYGPVIMQLMGTYNGTIEPVPDHEVEEKPEAAEAPETAGETEAAEETETAEEAGETEETAGSEAFDDFGDEDGFGDSDEDEGTGISYQNYPRLGLSFLTFNFTRPAVHEMEVRQAMAWCMDRQQMMEDYCQGFGVVVDGYYGIYKWEYLLCTGGLEYPITLLEEGQEPDPNQAESRFPNMVAATAEEFEQMTEAWEALSLDNLVKYNVYDLDNDPERTEKVGVTKAVKLLKDAGWTLNREGGEFRPGTDDVRCKMIDGELVALDLTMMYPRTNHIVDTIQENFFDYLAEAGIKVTLVPEDMEELLKEYYNEKERTTDMIYLATNFHVVVDPSITYSMDKTVGHKVWNNTWSDDEELWNRAVDMRKTEPGDIYTYMGKWISFQERYNEVLPAIPLYSNVYFDFYTSQLQNYFITTHVTWTQAILESYFGETPGEEEEEGDDEEDDGGAAFSFDD